MEAFSALHETSNTAGVAEPIDLRRAYLALVNSFGTTATSSGITHLNVCRVGHFFCGGAKANLKGSIRFARTSFGIIRPFELNETQVFKQRWWHDCRHNLEHNQGKVAQNRAGL